MRTKKRSKKIQIQAKPLTEEQIKNFVVFFNENGSFPGSKIPCSVTGKLTTCIGPWMKKKIKEFGGAENLLRNYKCRGALKAERQLIKPIMKSKRRQVAKKLKDENKDWSIPKIEFTPPRPMNQSEIQETSKTQCFRPDIFISNGRHCEGCEYFDICQNDLRCLPKYASESTYNKKIKAIKK